MSRANLQKMWCRCRAPSADGRGRPRSPAGRATRGAAPALRGGAAAALTLLFLVLPGCAKSGSKAARGTAYYRRALQDFAHGRCARAAVWLGRASSCGNPTAMAILGRMYLNGRCIQANYGLAVRLLRGAAANGEIKAMRGLAYAYLRGLGVKQSFANARRWMTAASRSGAPWSFAELGDLYLHGRGVKRDRKKAFTLFLKAARLGSADGMQAVGTCYAHGWGVAKDAHREIHWLLRATEAGGHKFIESLRDSRPRRVACAALTQIGLVYENGLGVRADRRKAEFYYQWAMRLGSLRATVGLGHLYQNWPARPGLRVKAVGLFRGAAVRGSAAAAWYLASCYQHGIGIRKDLRLAAKWYSAARERLGARVARGDRHSQYMLAMILLTGVPEEPARAIRILANLADSGKPRYEFLYGTSLLANGKGRASAASGLKWIRKAARGGDDGAMRMLARAHQFGLWGLHRSPAMAEKWRRRAAAGPKELQK